MLLSDNLKDVNTIKQKSVIKFTRNFYNLFKQSHSKIELSKIKTD